MMDGANPPRPPAPANVRVLIVDDDHAHAEMVGEFLRISGYGRVDHAPDLKTFWQLLDSSPEDPPYDVILMDYKLPDGTGLDALAQMPARGYQIPVVMVTGQGTERVAAQAIQQGAADYILKSGEYLVTLPALIQKTVQAHLLQRQVQESLKQIRYQALLLNNVRDAVVVWDLQGKITFWNPAATSLFGWDAQDRLGRPVDQVYLPAFSPAVRPPARDEAADQPVVRRYARPDGQIIYVSSRVTALHDPEHANMLLGYMDVAHDITSRIQMEQALRESESRYRAIVEDYQTEMICRFKPNGTLTFVNEVYSQYFGLSREKLLGMNILYFVPEAERPRLVQHLISFGHGKTSATLEHQVQLPQQGLRWLQRTDRAIRDTQGRLIEFQSVARDVTDRKRLEEQIRAAQAHLVQAARLSTIGEMASGIAHQIYNPLTTIIAEAQILLRNLPANQPARESAEAIEQAGWRLQQAVQQLMEFSRPANAALLPLAVNETIQNAAALASAHIETIGCRLVVKLGENLPPVQGNQRQLENLWVNLLLLARDAVGAALPNGRQHTITIQSYADTPHQVTVEVIDDGRHIPAEQLATIFEPNFIGPSSGRGSGMELSLCREIVRQHGGQITAESTPGRDTIFRVTLPAED